MSFHFSRSATAVALALSVGLVALPACKKTKPTVADSPTTPTAPTPNPGPSVTPPGPSTGVVDPAAPKGPIFVGQNPRTAAVRITAEENMKQIGLAMHLFHDVNKALPAGYADKTGKPGLSWRVALLPYLEQENLFNAFKLDEPWDSESNKKLIDKMPKQFKPGGQDTRGYTFARGFTGPGTWLPQPAKVGTPGQLLLGANFGQFTDGTSTTILVADAGDAVIWTKPDEMLFDPKQPLPKLGGVFDTVIVAGMADGSVRLVPKGLSAKTLASAIQINDGGVVNFDK